MPSLDSGRAASHLLQVCSRKICSSPPSGSRKISWNLCPGHPRMLTAQYLYQGSHRERMARYQHQRQTRDPRSDLLSQAQGPSGRWKLLSDHLAPRRTGKGQFPCTSGWGPYLMMKPKPDTSRVGPKGT
jgi:hypothetical protein